MEFDAWWDELLTSKGLTPKQIKQVYDEAEQLKLNRKNLDEAYARKVKATRKPGESLADYKNRARQLLDMETYMLANLED